MALYNIAIKTIQVLVDVQLITGLGYLNGNSWANDVESGRSALAVSGGMTLWAKIDLVHYNLHQVKFIIRILTLCSSAS